ncbi:hypothetical protein [Anaerobiospirillum thomasii]|uniref:hypothetical protein n=1 Tax=Anaerobiospirillum thomasii TaxID=179995 RepID=UPI001559237B|nr:hypothetical protein [Anaerobiospirillum thomasii]
MFIIEKISWTLMALLLQQIDKIIHSDTALSVFDDPLLALCITLTLYAGNAR